MKELIEILNEAPEIKVTLPNGCSLINGELMLWNYEHQAPALCIRKTGFWYCFYTAKSKIESSLEQLKQLKANNWVAPAEWDSFPF